MAEEVDIDRDAEDDQAEAARMLREAEIEQSPAAADVAADAGIHEAREQRHAADMEDAGLRIDPGPDRGLENLHRRADDMVDQDDPGLLPCLELSCQ